MGGFIQCAPYDWMLANTRPLPLPRNVVGGEWGGEGAHSPLTTFLCDLPTVNSGIIGLSLILAPGYAFLFNNTICLQNAFENIDLIVGYAGIILFHHPYSRPL